ncbi:MAG: bifunctional DNA-formamidopyrimidine glycosylase/DNA-(apurinic or apyrimidinic site) lyase [Gammaproteobacteria bacterium]|nr:bifunctional DNA-formamidopyrimidine glycosylase/DNA-(apurinic or apyrimidinic site) lyase [Gammaproteobacteria bacterium]MXW44777.1 bifunctional DNA-formamidopyrimidine glycosylase/DNA-(apurinic or apyrimidinic site) lyase [Gammaproteobacteria bacterium]MYD01019.1 bifunctional DNA-formamidopyrimidine glycosylase/DNA-(apurinic or apyrimidinic site) lyase [Gammaproteobacteria bacterium]MYI23973.1 bifunctional DNA-formamidopyrimidine glycosylase/DNA-(apurinic or apyrimidinic site) lyase [Gammap
MPELPEVETTRRGIEPLVAGSRVERVAVRERRLRWPIPGEVERQLTGATMLGVRRRAKYLLLESERGTAIAHLGMSGSFSVVAAGTEPGVHDHYDVIFDGGKALRFTDPRKFGSLLWGGREPLRHKLLADLGPEPFSAEFSGAWLKKRSLGRRVAVKSFLMMPAVVAGMGNIYASEALYRAGIHPRRAAGRIALRRYEALARVIRDVLGEAIESGGTTLRDFADASGRPGYFAQRLDVYDRAGRECRRCGSAIRRRVIGQRASYYCARCQG